MTQGPAARISPTRFALESLLLAAAILAVGELVRRFTPAWRGVPPVWFPAGIGFGAAWRLGRRSTLGVGLGNLALNHVAGAPPLAGLLIAAGHVLGMELGGGYLRASLGPRPGAIGTRGVLRILGPAALGATLVAVLGGLAPWMVLAGSDAGEILHQCVARAPSTYLGILAVGPLLVVGGMARPGTAPGRGRLESVALLGLATLSATVVFCLPFSSVAGRHPLAYLVLPALAWGALRFGLRGAARVSFVVAATAAVGTVHQLGPFDVGAGLSGLIDLQVFLGVVSAVALFLGGAVDEREGAASALRRSEARLAAAFDHVPFELFLLDDGLTCVMQNATSRASWGDQRGRTPATTTLPEPVIRVFRPKLERALGGEVVRGEATYGEGAEARRVLEVFAPVREGDRFVGLLGVHVDLSDRVRAEAERERLQAQLAQTQRMDSIGRLAGGIAHDINNLLTPILGYAELALDETPTTMRTHGWLEGMGGAARRIQDLTGKLLAFGRRQPPLRTTVELGAQVRAFAGILRRTIREDVRIELDLDPAGVHVRADPALLDQVLLNLVVNAQDAIEGRGVVTISTRRRTVSAQVASAHEPMVPGGYGALAVRDTGAGMDAETLARAFEPFFTTKAAREGNGLGLATVYGIVRGHGGGVVVTSAPGEGSTFEALLPEVEAPPVSAAASTPPTAPSAEVSRGRRVLLVEDEAEVRSLVRDVLVARGHEVTDLGDPRDALALASDPARRVDLLLTDVILPQMRGPEPRGPAARREARPGRAVHDRPRRRHPRAGGPVAHRRPGPAQALQRRGPRGGRGGGAGGAVRAPTPPPRAGARGRRGPRGCSCRPPTRGRRPRRAGGGA